MIYKTGDTVYEVKDNTIVPHVIDQWKFVTWIQALLIDGKWRDSRDFYETQAEAERQLQPRRNQP